MSLDHYFLSKNQDKEVLYFGHNFFIHEAFKHVLNSNYDFDKFEVHKEDIKNSVEKLESILDCFQTEEHDDTVSFDHGTDDWLVNMNHVIVDDTGCVALEKAILMYPSAVANQLKYHGGTLLSGLDYMFFKIKDAYEKLKSLLNTFDFENDKLLISQGG